MKKISLSLFFIVLVALLFTSCGFSASPDTEKVLCEILSVSGESIENGNVYFLGAEEWEVGYFSDETKLLLYGEDGASVCFDPNKTESCAVFISANVPSELAVFKCRSASDTADIARVMLKRADELKVALRGSEWEEKSSDIRVCIHKKYVMLCFVNNGKKAEDKFNSAV